MNSVPTLADKIYESWVVGLFDLKEYAADIPLLLQGKHNKIYDDRPGTLPLPPSYARVAVVVIWPNPHSLPFTLNLMRGLAENGFFVLAVSLQRVSGAMADAYLAHCHRLVERFPIGRDFGCYKWGIEWLQKQSFWNEIEVLGLVNDSMYYPRTMGATIRELLEGDRAAPWLALYENFQCYYHVQSFFQFFRPPVFRSKEFLDFWKVYVPFTSRGHTIHKGEAQLTRTLRGAGHTASILYNTRKLRADLMRYLEETPPDADRLFRYVLFTTMARIPRGWRDALTSFRFEDSFNLDITDIVHKVSVMAENHNPTHSVGLLCNHLYGAPIKRDICSLGIHTIADMINFAKGFNAEELGGMYEDLRAKTTHASYYGKQRILKLIGRV